MHANWCAHHTRVNMPIPLEALLALKVFHIGLAAENVASRASVLSMLNCAIDYLSTLSNDESILRLAFYHAAKAEVFRKSGGDPIADRQAAQKLSNNIQSNFYDWYLKVEEATESLTGEGCSGSTSPYAAGGGSNPDPNNPFASYYGRVKRALTKLGLVNELSQDQYRFLEKATLLDMFRKHGITYEP